MEDDESVMVEAEETRVGNNSLLDVVKGPLTSVCPDINNWIVILALDSQCPKRCHPELKVVNIFAVELGKANKLSNIMDNLGLRPSPKKLVLQLSRPDPLGTNVIPNKFEIFRENVAFLEAEGQMVHHAYSELAFHV
jgi:hypothetical protein